MKTHLVYSAKFKRNYVAVFAVLLFFVIIFGEIFLAVYIPMYMRNSQSLSMEVSKRYLLMEFDALRRDCDGIAVKNNSVWSEEKQLMLAALDDLGKYLRANKHRLSGDEIADFRTHLAECRKIINRLSRTQFSKTESIDTEKYVKRLELKYREALSEKTRQR